MAVLNQIANVVKLWLEKCVPCLACVTDMSTAKRKYFHNHHLVPIIKSSCHVLIAFCSQFHMLSNTAARPAEASSRNPLRQNPLRRIIHISQTLMGQTAFKCDVVK